jgi:magnesium-transporting ATPase (P-type)
MTSSSEVETPSSSAKKSMWSRLLACARECIGSSKARTPYREILVNPWQPKELLQQEGKDRRLNFTNNAVITAKYNAVTFVPRAVLEQFRRMANLYFLLISSMMFIGSYTYIFDSPLTPWSTLIPLLVVLAITIGKEGAEDLKRHEADKQTNNRLVERLRDRIPGEVLAHCGVAGTSNMFHKVTWKELVPGDIIKVHNKENIPADIIVLLTSEQGGACYIETSNIDGETNLKIKRCAHTESVGSAWKAPNQLVGYVYVYFFA